MLNRRKPLKRSAIPPRNPKRRRSEFARCYHSKERVEFVKRMPCIRCGLHGYSDNAHVGRKGAGAGRKADYDQIAPLCGWPSNHIGGDCHGKLHRGQLIVDAGTRANWCAYTEQQWQARCA